MPNQNKHKTVPVKTAPSALRKPVRVFKCWVNCRDSDVAMQVGGAQAEISFNDNIANGEVLVPVSILVYKDGNVSIRKRYYTPDGGATTVPLMAIVTP